MFESASERALHIASAVSWYHDQLKQSQEFRDVFSSLVKCINEAAVESHDRRQIHFVALGKSAGVAKLAVAMLNSVGVRACFIHATEAFHGDIGSVKADDCVVCISYTGRTAELAALIPHLRERNCRIFALTSRTTSPLAQLSDAILPLPAVSEFCPLDQAPITSPVTTLALCQLLVAASMELRAFELEKYARNHPGGAIGKRIFVRVDDLMAKGDKLPKVTEDETFSGCISAMTKFAKAGIVVVKGDTLLGLIAEKDLRTAMEKFGPKVFEKNARDLMNASPITIESGTLAVEALRFMENRPRPLNLIPVVDGKKVLGLLHTHDLVAEGIALS